MKNEEAPTLERMADCVTLLKRGPHTAAEIAARLGVGKPAVKRYCEAFAQKGHARECEPKTVRGNPAKVWEWVL